MLELTVGCMSMPVWYLAVSDNGPLFVIAFTNGMASVVFHNSQKQANLSRRKNCGTVLVQITRSIKLRSLPSRMELPCGLPGIVASHLGCCEAVRDVAGRF